jgi:hypothetical protein
VKYVFWKIVKYLLFELREGVALPIFERRQPRSAALVRIKMETLSWLAP